MRLTAAAENRKETDGEGDEVSPFTETDGDEKKVYVGETGDIW